MDRKFDQRIDIKIKSSFKLVVSMSVYLNIFTTNLYLPFEKLLNCSPHLRGKSVRVLRYEDRFAHPFSEKKEKNAALAQQKNNERNVRIIKLSNLLKISH